MTQARLWRGALACFCLVSSSARAQSVAFQPVVNLFPDGVVLNATPSVSADGRYVRMTLAPQFTALEGFTTVPVPAAVGGGGGFAQGNAAGAFGLAGLNGPIVDENGTDVRPSYPTAMNAGRAAMRGTAVDASESSDFEDRLGASVRQLPPTRPVPARTKPNRARRRPSTRANSVKPASPPLSSSR